LVRYTLKDLSAIVASPFRWKIIVPGIWTAAWPLVRPLAGIYRRTALARMRLAGVTGSFGKTTTCRALGAALDAPFLYDRGGNNSSGIARRMLRLRQGAFGVLELGIDGPGQMAGFSAMVRPQIGVISGIGTEHRRSLGSTETTQREKGELLRALPEDGTAIFNADLPLVREMIPMTRARAVLCGEQEDADVRLLAWKLNWPHGNWMRVSVGGREIELQTRFAGWQMLFPVLAGLAAAWTEGLDLDEAKARLEALPPTPGRMEPVDVGRGVTVLNDAFKSSYETFATALDQVAAIPAKRRLLVVADISEPPVSQTQAYLDLGEHFARVDDAYILHVGRDYRRLRAGAIKSGFPKERIEHLGKSVLAAIGEIQKRVQPGDLILLKGRDVQRMERVMLALQGREVGCDLQYCDLRSNRCDTCPVLAGGWEGLPKFRAQAR